MFHILLFLLHRRFKETYFNLIRSSNRCSQMLFLFLMGLTAVRCRFSRQGLKPLCPICDRYHWWPSPTVMVYTTQKSVLWSYHTDGEDVVSQIMRGFLLFIPQINLNLHLQIWDSNWISHWTCSPPWVGCWMNSWAPNVPKWSTKDRRSTSCPFNCLPNCIAHLVRNVGCAHAPSWSLLDAEQKMGSMW